MATLNSFVTANKSISLNTLLALLVICVPVVMFFFILSVNNPFIDGSIVFLVFLMSVFLLLVMRINQNLHIPILDTFLLIYIFFWHLRFLTLTMFPSGELVLTRSIAITPEVFYSYTGIVFVALFATVAGILIAYSFIQSSRKKTIVWSGYDADNLSKTVKNNIFGIFIYCLMSFAFLVIATQLIDSPLPVWVGYVSLLFPFNLTLFLVVLVLFNTEISGKYRALFLAYALVYTIMTVLVGSRSIMINFIIGWIFLAFIFKKNITFKFRQFVMILLLGFMMVVSFIFGTSMRGMRDISGFQVTNETLGHALESTLDKEKWMPLISMATARAGFLDFSAEMFINPKYGEVITGENIAKAVIDGYIPGVLTGDMFDDSRLLEHRIRDIYSSSKVGYQSDAIGAVGENYILFGYLFPLMMLLVSFIFTYLYYAINSNILGVYIKFVIAMGVMAWWNSFGYDLLLIDTGRQLIVGVLEILLILSLSKSWKRYTSVGIQL